MRRIGCILLKNARIRLSSKQQRNLIRPMNQNVFPSMHSGLKNVSSRNNIQKNGYLHFNKGIRLSLIRFIIP
jgi:hypothetical protein